MITAWGDIGSMTAPTAEALAVIFGAGMVAVATELVDEIVNSRAAAWALPYAGQLVAGIDETTRERIAELVAQVMASPDASVADLRDAIASAFGDMSESRAETIARTETAYAAGYGNVAGWRETDTNYVEIDDGTDFDAECQEADGSVWSIDYYESNVLEHPNCGRSASGISDEEALSRGVDHE